MNINLKNPRQLKDSYSQDTNFIHSEPELSIQQASLDSILDTPDLENATSKPHQSTMQTFLDETKPKELVLGAKVKLSKYFPMKFGIRKRLQEENVSYTIVESDLHLVIFNKVLLQVFDPIKILETSFQGEMQDLSELCELLFVIFDFIHFQEKKSGEKRGLKNKITELQKKGKFQVIPIENEEELYFIIKSILESPQARGL